MLVFMELAALFYHLHNRGIEGGAGSEENTSLSISKTRLPKDFRDFQQSDGKWVMMGEYWACKYCQPNGMDHNECF